MSMTQRSHCWSGLRPATVRGSTMFSSTVSAGIRWNAWKTKPIRSLRSRVRERSPRRDSSTSPSQAPPDVPESSPARQCMSVDLPEPEGPMIAANSPRRNATETLSRATTWASDCPYTLVRFTAEAAAAGSTGGVRWAGTPTGQGRGEVMSCSSGSSVIGGRGCPPWGSGA